jgi:hypothetical protein
MQNNLSKKSRLKNTLSDGQWHTNYELNQTVTHRFGALIFDLRKEGCDIETLPSGWIALRSLLERLEKKKRIEEELLESNRNWDDNNLEIKPNFKESQNENSNHNG